MTSRFECSGRHVDIHGRYLLFVPCGKSKNEPYLAVECLNVVKRCFLEKLIWSKAALGCQRSVTVGYSERRVVMTCEVYCMRILALFF